MGRIAKKKLAGKLCGYEPCMIKVKGKGEIAFCSDYHKELDEGKAQKHKDTIAQWEEEGRYILHIDLSND